MLAARNSVLTFLIGLPFERAIKWHFLLAVITEGLSVYHGLVALGLWASAEGRINASDVIWYSGGGLRPAWLGPWGLGIRAPWHFGARVFILVL